MALALFSGLPLLKIPDPTNTPSTPSCIRRETSAGVAVRKGEKIKVRMAKDGKNQNVLLGIKVGRDSGQ